MYYTRRIPNDRDGKNGDVAIVDEGRGIYLYAKAKSRWYQTQRLELKNHSLNRRRKMAGFQMTDNIVLNGKNISGNNAFQEGLTIDAFDNEVYVKSTKGLKVKNDVKLNVGKKIYFDTDETTSNNYISSDASGNVKIYVDGVNALSATSSKITGLTAEFSRTNEDEEVDSGNMMIENTSSTSSTAHAYITLKTSKTDTHSFINYVNKVIGETEFSWNGWCVGNNAVGDIFNWVKYPGSEHGAVTPGYTTGSNPKMSLAPDGDLTLAGSLTTTDLISSGPFTLNCTSTIELNADGGQVTIKDDSASHFLFNCDTTSFTIYDDTDAADLFSITVGASGITTIATVDDGAAVGHLTLAPDGDLIVDIGGDVMMQMTENGADGNQVSFTNASVGFTQIEPTYDATNTAVDFRHSNKQFLTFGSGNIANLNMYFPLVSGNFVLLVKQDGTGSRTIGNYKVFEFDESSADGSYPVKWAGGSQPDLTDDANHVDILSFYWDADNEIAYGVATLDFQF